MNRATGVYVIMFLIFGSGLWLILSLDWLVQAPPDLAGTWKLQPISAPGRFKHADEITVQQSGKFIEITFLNTGERLPMRLVSVDPSPNSATSVDIRLKSSPGMIFSGNPRGDRFRVQTDEKQPHIWNAVRTLRTYPKPESDSKPAEAQATTRAS